MNETSAICTFSIIALTSIFSVIGFRNRAFREKYLFSVPEILAGKQYYRLFTSAFLHADWNHLLMNMLSLYFFGRSLEFFLGAKAYLLVYFAAIVGGDLLSLAIHRHHEYRAYGASGGVCGMMFSFIILFPGGTIIAYPIPVPVPGWLYAVLFIVGSFLALKRQTDNVGHDAHLGGAIIGMWTTAVLQPWIVRENWKLFLAISALSVLLFLYLVKNPLFLPLSSFLPTGWSRKARSPKQGSTGNERFELDAILDKISRSGMDSLSLEEKAKLNSASENYQRRSESKKPESDLIF